MNDFILGFCLGFIFLVILYNLQWFFITKEKRYFYYVVLQIFLLLLLFDVAQSIIFLQIVIGISIVVFLMLFSKEFFEFKNHQKTTDKYISYLSISLFIIAMGLYFTNNALFLTYMPYSILILAILIIGYKNIKSSFFSNFLMLGWIVLFICLFLADMDRIFKLQITQAKYFIHIGNIIQALLFSYALSVKTKMQKEEIQKMLFHKSRLATMGEMLASISHQWRQPLNRIASFIMNMHIHIDEKYGKDEYLFKKLDETQNQLEYMSNTIEDFTNFYKKETLKKDFSVAVEVQRAINIIEPSLKNIELKLDIDKNLIINGFSNQFSQAVLLILQNAKDVLLQKDIVAPFIWIKISENLVCIEDNAGGISLDIIEKIYDPYFTTKERYQGTGLGLYMAKMILEQNMNTTLTAQNTQNGVKFIIRIH